MAEQDKYIIVIESCEQCAMAGGNSCYEYQTFGRELLPSRKIPPWCKRPGLTKVTMEDAANPWDGAEFINPWNENERRKESGS